MFRGENYLNIAEKYRIRSQYCSDPENFRTSDEVCFTHKGHAPFVNPCVERIHCKESR